MPIVACQDAKRTPQGGMLRGGKRLSRDDNLTGSRSPPLVSVITIVRNGIGTIERTIASVLAQTYTNLEYIVIDGESSDGTIQILKRYDKLIDYWVSEADSGISDAFNKGIEASRGVYHVLLNADDWYKPNAIATLVGALRDDVLVACASAYVVDSAGSVMRRFDSIPLDLPKKMSLVHNTCLVKTSVWKEFGGYNPRKMAAMDHELMLKIFTKYGSRSFNSVNNHISYYSLGGLSDNNYLKGFGEVRDNLIANGVARPIAYFRFLVLIAKHSVARTGFYRWVRSRCMCDFRP